MTATTPPASPEPPVTPRDGARVVLLTGPSGSGKSHLAARSGLPTVGLDDFYRDGDDPALPVGELGIADWDDPRAWDADRAFTALATLLTTGHVELPVYDITQDRTVGTRPMRLDGATVVVAEGIFAAELVTRCRDAGLLADALCLVQPSAVTFWRRLVRDLREGRKAPLTLVRRGLALRRDEPRVIARLVGLGAAPIHHRDARDRLARLAAR